ncbi:MAG: M20 family metallo-hydrolase [Caldiserica bacterium]|nr:M20 family metallo-hydrolase [Caldisericota bacterium]
MNKVPEEAEFVMDILRGNGKMSTSQVEEEIKKQGINCKDAAATFLPSLKAGGFIKSEFKNKTWYWWVDESAS